ncbi:MAG: hypothetical protein KF763_03625 [Cyclobacteriaceae bacterium]|nr:hypothetical protein [Cyclobacteriaceae bacterium]
MRIIKELLKGDIKITLYYWNNRYLLKLEWGFFEQTFKIHEWDVTSEADIDEILNDEFLAAATSRFNEMAAALGKALNGIS